MSFYRNHRKNYKISDNHNPFNLNFSNTAQFSNYESSHSYSNTPENSDNEDEDSREIIVENYFNSESDNKNNSKSDSVFTNYMMTSENDTYSNSSSSSSANGNYSRTVETTTLNPKIFDDNFTRYDFLLPIIGIWFCIGILLLLLFLWFARCLMMSNRKKQELFLLKHEKYKEMIEQTKMKKKEMENGGENQNEQDLSLCQHSIDNSQTMSSQESTGSVFTLVETVSTKKNSQEEMSIFDSEMMKFTSPNHRQSPNPIPIPLAVPGPSHRRSSTSYSQVLKFYTMDWKVEQYELEHGSKYKTQSPPHSQSQSQYSTLKM